MPKKSSAKSPASSDTVPQPHGGALRRGGKPGNKGGTGRPSKAFLQRCIEATENDALWSSAAEKSPMGVLDLAAAYAHGKPVQKVEAEVSLKLVKVDV